MLEIGEIKMKIIINGKIENKPYEEICKLLCILPEVQFVKVTKAGTIDFTIGKPNEINFLISKIDSAGMQMSTKFKKWAKTNGFLK